MSFEEAAGLGLGVATAALGLFQELGVPASLFANQQSKPLDDSICMEPEIVLVAGGSTATGTRAIQMLKLYVFLFPLSCFLDRMRPSCSSVVLYCRMLINDHSAPDSAPSQLHHRQTSNSSSASVQRRSSIIIAKLALQTFAPTPVTTWHIYSIASLWPTQLSFAMTLWGALVGDMSRSSHSERPSPLLAPQ